MADLYGVNIGDVESKARVIEAPNTANTFGTAVDALAKGIGAFSQRADNIAQRKRQDAATARQAQQDALAAAGRADHVESETLASDVTTGTALINAGSLGDTFQSTAGDVPLAQTPPDPRITADVGAAAKQVASTAAAVDQGRMPAISKQAQVDLLFNRLLVKYPSKAHEIAKQFKDLGVDSALFDELKNEVDTTQSALKADREHGVKMQQLAQENLPAETYAKMTPQEQTQWGLDYTRQQNILDSTVKNATLQNTLTNTTQSQYKFNQEQIGDEFVTNASGMVMQAIAPLAKSMQELVLASDEPGANVGRDQRLGSLVAQARTMGANLITKVISQGGFSKTEDVTKVTNYINSQIESLIVKPYEDRNKGFAQASQMFQTRLGLNAAVSAPVIHDLRTRFGIRVEDIPGIMTSLPPDVLNSVRSEFMGAGKPGINRNIATIHLTNALAVLKGEKSLAYIDTPEERQAAVATNFNYVKNHAREVANGGGNADYWLNGARTMVVASAGFGPNTPTTTLQTYSSAVLSEHTINAINKLQSGPNGQEAKELGVGVRASAAQVLSASQRQFRTVNRSNTDPYRIAMNADGHYEIVKNPNWKAPLTTRNEFPGGDARTGQARPTIPSDMSRMVGSANVALSFLTATGNWDGDAPKGTPKEVRRFWATGGAELTPDLRSKKVAQQKRGDFDTMANALERDLSKAPDLITAPTVTSGGSSRGERNNNPGNLEDSPYTRSQPGYKGSDGRFAKFETPEHGLKAQETLLAKNYIGKGYNTVAKVIGRYAPRSDNAQSFDNYVAYVSQKLNINPNDTLTPSMTGRLAQAMREFETGNRSS